jgi:hypothetical protein
VSGRELAVRLRHRRESLPGLTVKGIADQLDVTRNYWTLVETNRAILTEPNMAKVLDILGFNDDPGEAAELAELHRQARTRGWWQDYRGMYPDEGMRFFGLEAGADRIRSFESLLMPGLLQHADYARVVIGADPQYSPVELDQRVAIRMKRQERVWGDQPLKMSYILSEAVLHQFVGGRELQIRQLQHLIGAIEQLWENLEVRVVRFTTDIGVLASASTLVLMDFPSAHLETVAWQEAIRPLGVVDDPERIRRLELGWDTGKRSALDRESSLALIRSVAEDLAQEGRNK